MKMDTDTRTHTDGHGRARTGTSGKAGGIGEAFGGDEPVEVSVSLTRDEARALWGLGAQVMEAIAHWPDCRAWGLRVAGAGRIVVSESEMELVASALVAVREAGR